MSSCHNYNRMPLEFVTESDLCIINFEKIIGIYHHHVGNGKRHEFKI